jgi:hypothetical protein
MRAKRRATWSMAARPCRRARPGSGQQTTQALQPARWLPDIFAHAASPCVQCCLPPAPALSRQLARRCAERGTARRRAGGGLWRTRTLRPWTWATARTRPCLACLTGTAAGASDLTRARPACAACTVAGCPPPADRASPSPGCQLPHSCVASRARAAPARPCGWRARRLTHARRACAQRGGKVLPKVHGEGDDAASAVPRGQPAGLAHRGARAAAPPALCPRVPRARVLVGHSVCILAALQHELRARRSKHRGLERRPPLLGSWLWRLPSQPGPWRLGSA